MKNNNERLAFAYTEFSDLEKAPLIPEAVIKVADGLECLPKYEQEQQLNKVIERAEALDEQYKKEQEEQSISHNRYKEIENILASCIRSSIGVTDENVSSWFEHITDTDNFILAVQDVMEAINALNFLQSKIIQYGVKYEKEQLVGKNAEFQLSDTRFDVLSEYVRHRYSVEN